MDVFCMYDFLLQKKLSQYRMENVCCLLDSYCTAFETYMLEENLNPFPKTNKNNLWYWYWSFCCFPVPDKDSDKTRLFVWSASANSDPIC